MIEQPRLNDEFAGKLRRRYVETMYKDADQQSAAEEEFLALLRRRHAMIEVGLRGPAAREQADRFESLMREWNPVGFGFRAEDLLRLVGPATLKGEGFVEYSIDDGATVARWRFSVGTYLRASERWSILAVDYSTTGTARRESKTDEATKPGDKTPRTKGGESDSLLATERVWRAFVDARTREEVASARRALRENLKDRYPGINAALRRGTEARTSSVTAAKLLREWNPTLWPLEDVKVLMGPPTSEEKEQVMYHFEDPLLGLFSRRIFQVRDGIIVGYEVIPGH